MESEVIRKRNLGQAGQRSYSCKMVRQKLVIQSQRFYFRLDHLNLVRIVDEAEPGLEAKIDDV